MRDKISIAARSPMSASRVTRPRHWRGAKEGCVLRCRTANHDSGGGGGGRDFDRLREKYTKIATAAIARIATPAITSPLPKNPLEPAGVIVMLPTIFARSARGLPGPRSLRYGKVPVRLETVKL